MNRPVSLAIGATVGGGAGYFIASIIADYLDEKELRDRVPSPLEEEPADEDEDESSRRTSSMSKKKKRQRREKVNYSQYFQSVNRPDLAALVRKYKEGEEPEETQGIKAELISEDEAEKFIKPVPVSNDITIISQDEFNNNPDDFEVVELSYYADEIVVGDDDNIIPGPEDIIGHDALVSFGSLSGDPDIVYVRNQKTRALYEIVRMSVKYAIDADAEKIKPRRGLKVGIDFDEVKHDEQKNEEDDS